MPLSLLPTSCFSYTGWWHYEVRATSTTHHFPHAVPFPLLRRGIGMVRGCVCDVGGKGGGVRFVVARPKGATGRCCRKVIRSLAAAAAQNKGTGGAGADKKDKTHMRVLEAEEGLCWGGEGGDDYDDYAHGYERPPTMSLPKLRAGGDGETAIIHFPVWARFFFFRALSFQGSEGI